MKRVVFIMGTGHSGSTLLDLVLGSHSKGFSLGEFSAVSRSLKSGRLTGALCKLCGQDCPFWSQPDYLSVLESYFRGSGTDHWIGSQLYNRFGAIRMNIYEYLFQWTMAETLIDSSKSVSWIRRQLTPFWHWQDVAPFLVYVYRDGRAVTNSYLRKHPSKEVRDVVDGWMNFVQKMENFYTNFPIQRRIRVSYEHFCVSPTSTLRSLCDFLGISFEPEMLEYWKQDHHVLQCNARTRSLIVKYRESKTTLENGFTQQPELGIQLDLRWKRELSADQLQEFERLAGQFNRPYAWQD